LPNTNLSRQVKHPVDTYEVSRQQLSVAHVAGDELNFGRKRRRTTAVDLVEQGVDHANGMTVVQ
jgi:hypothetical protein